MTRGISPFTTIRGLGICLSLWIFVSPVDASAADTIWSWKGNSYEVTASQPIPVGRGPLWSVTLTVAGEDDVIPNTFDSTKSGSGGMGITTAGNQLHQVWAFNATPTPLQTLESGDLIPRQDLDTHFLVDRDDVSFSIRFPGENREVLDPFEDEWGGFGSFLDGTFSVRGRTDDTWPFALIVVPADTEVILDFEIGAVGFPSEVVSGSFNVESRTPNPPGDLDFNSWVDRGDAALLIRNLGVAQGAESFHGDLDGDEAVTLNDLLELQLGLDRDFDDDSPEPKNFLREPGQWRHDAPSRYENPVPEPPGMILCAVGAIGLLVRPRRARSCSRI